MYSEKIRSLQRDINYLSNELSIWDGDHDVYLQIEEERSHLQEQLTYLIGKEIRYLLGEADQI